MTPGYFHCKNLLINTLVRAYGRAKGYQLFHGICGDSSSQWFEGQFTPDPTMDVRDPVSGYYWHFDEMVIVDIKRAVESASISDIEKARLMKWVTCERECHRYEVATGRGTIRVGEVIPAVRPGNIVRPKRY